MKNKKVIFISAQNVFNPTSGVESRINNLVKDFSKENSLTIFAPNQNIKKGNKNFFGLEYHSKFKKLLDKRIFKKALEIHEKNKFDLIYATTLWSGLNGMILSKKIKIPFYFDNHNVEFLRFKRSRNWIWPIIYFYERLICKSAEKVICVSETDKKFHIKYFKLNPKKIIVLENPVDKKIFYPNNKNSIKIRKELGLNKGEKFILFFGQLDYKPNIEALKIINEEILPRLDKKRMKYKIVVCGKGDGKGLLKKFNHKNLIFKGFVEKIQDYINASDIIIAPLKSGSGTRIKILEALACNKKVISTSVGAEGIKENKFLEVEDDWENFVKKI
jgi:glycosyltransferase involved in cell wall biosynthesis